MSRRAAGYVNTGICLDSHARRLRSVAGLGDFLCRRSAGRSFYRTQANEAEAEEVDFCVVGGGPAGLSFSIRLMQNASKDGRDVRVMLIEKAAVIGAHNLSGAVIEPRSLNELFPDWRKMDSPIKSKVSKNLMAYFTKNYSIPLPHPPSLSNKNNYVVSISALCRWLAERAEELGVEVYPGFAGSKLLYNKQGRVIGVSTNDLGVGRDGKPKENFEKGLNILAKSTIIAEGCRGSLSKELLERFSLDSGSHQTYGLGLKEVWEIPAENYIDGLVFHSVGWPAKSDYYGGGFVYHFDGDKCSIGYVVGLDYTNPTINPYKEFQLFKTHPSLYKYLRGGKVLNYGAKALNEGGLQGIPKLVFPGGALIGCSAGFLDVLKIKGIHTAMKSGMLCADVAYDKLKAMVDPTVPLDLSDYQKSLDESWVRRDLWKSRNIRPSFSKLGLLGGLAYSGIDNMILRGRAPWTFKFKEKDHLTLKPLKGVKPKVYPKPDGVITFPLLENLSRSGTNHEEDQPCHLQLISGQSVHLKYNLPVYGGPEQYYCPAGVYEFVDDGNNPPEKRFQINSQNCIHCKTCDIKDPKQNIKWTSKFFFVIILSPAIALISQIIISAPGRRRAQVELHLTYG